jgi:AraC-like DNA-binding protein
MDMTAPIRRASEDTEAELDAQDLMARGFAREALRQLMRVTPEDPRHAGDDRRLRAQDPSWLSLQLGLCYAMLGMDRDALDACVQAEREAVNSPLRDERLDQTRCLRLWITVLYGRIDGTHDLIQSLTVGSSASIETTALAFSALIVYAIRSDHLRFARRLVVLAPVPKDKDGLASAVLELCSAEVSFREILAALPQFEGALEARYFQHCATEPSADLAQKTTRLAEQLEFLESRLRRWPLIQELATALRLSARILSLQLKGQLPRMSALELRVGAMGHRGLVALHRHTRFLLGFLNLHQGRTTVAEAWLCDGSAQPSWVRQADAHELLVVANGRSQLHDWANSLTYYRAYVRRVAERAETMSSLGALLAPPPARALEWHRSGATALIPGAITPALAAASASIAARGALRTVSDRRVTDSRRTTNAVRDLIESDLARPLLVADVAARLGIARRTIENRVRIESGCSVKRFVTELRLQHAYRLVLEQAPVDAHGLQAIAMQVGFSSYRAFCNAYTRSFGRIPHRRGRPRHDSW